MPTRRISARRRDRKSIPMRKDVNNFIARIKHENLLAIGHRESWPKRDKRLKNLYADFPPGRSLEEYKSIISAACASKRLAILMVKGTLIGQIYHDELFTHVMKELVKSTSIICVNFGEFHVEDGYAKLVNALPNTFVGHCYYTDPVTPPQREIKKKCKKVLSRNRLKWGYRAQLARDDVWGILQHGCQAWWNPKEKGREYAVKYSQDYKLHASKYPQRCRRDCLIRRCAGLSVSSQKRCCLCTRHASGYCRHHRW